MSSIRFYSKAIGEFNSYTTVKIFRNKKQPSKYESSIRRKCEKDIDKLLAFSQVRLTEDDVKHEEQIDCKKVLPLSDEQQYSDSPEYFQNVVKIQLIPENLHKQLFPEQPRSNCNKNNANDQKIKYDLQRHGIDFQSTERIGDVNIKLPPLKGKNIEEHFYEIGREQVEPYKKLLKPLLDIEALPTKPNRWSFKPGWTVYDPGSGEATTVDYPSDDGLVFDVEVCVSDSPMPVMATAVSSKCWYSWVSERLASDHTELRVTRELPRYTSEELIPLGKNGPKLIIGHNVSYDRARLKEQYQIEDTHTRFLDTMSLHVCVSGVTSYQRALLKSKKEPASEDVEWRSQSSLNSLAEVHRLYCGGSTLSKDERNIFVEGSMQDVRQDFQSLMDYCSNDVAATHRVLQMLYPLFEERFPHPVTLAGMLEMGTAYLPVNKNWMRYIKDSDLTYEDLSIEAKYHLARRADEACSLLKDEAYKKHLWMWDEDWSTQELKIKKLPKKRKASTSTNVGEHEKYSDLTAEEIRLYKKFQHLYDLKDQLPARRPLLPGYPAWYRKLCKKPPKEGKRNENDWSPGPSEISTGMQIAPKLLSLCWEGYPLHYTREQGWGFLVPFSTKLMQGNNDTKVARIPIEELTKHCPIPEFAQAFATEQETDYAFGLLHRELDNKLGKREFYSKKPKKDKTQGLYKGSGVWCNQILDNCCFFLKLPHKNGKSLRVGNPLSRDFLSKFSENVLTSGESGNNVAKRVIEIARMMSYWRNNRERIKGQMIVWLSPDELPVIAKEWVDYEYGAICPQVVTCGTLTRRAMEPTWMTASNSQKERIGSELRALVQAPPNYRFVGADVDSQELWIASVLGDAYAYGIHGATPLGWMTLSGNKANGTDMHSVTAKAVGISRDHAKVINYARIYGAGQNFAEGLLKQFNPTFSVTEAKTKAAKMFAITKGKKVYRLKEEYHDDFSRKSYSGYEALKLASSNNKSVPEMFERPCWEGGTESAMFNRLEEIATGAEPITPFLGCRLSRALETSNSSEENRFLPTRINWVVQSGAVDFLHLMLVSMRWLLGDKARFCLSFHDELRYLVEEKHAHHAALAMHITNLLTRTFCSSRLGLYDLPMSVAFFSSVEVDSVLRKECTMDCVTPSNPHGLKLGYGIEAGESLSIQDAIEKADCKDLSKWEWIK